MKWKNYTSFHMHNIRIYKEKVWYRLQYLEKQRKSTDSLYAILRHIGPIRIVLSYSQHAAIRS